MYTEDVYTIYLDIVVGIVSVVFEVMFDEYCSFLTSVFFVFFFV